MCAKLTLFILLISLIQLTITKSVEIENTEIVKPNKDLKAKVLSTVNKEFDVADIYDMDKRSDIEERLMELKSRIALAKAYQQTAPGHGLINFDDIEKRSSDIEERLMELKSKIALAKAFAETPVGHGRFNFDDLEKRSNSESDLINMLAKANHANKRSSN